MIAALATIFAGELAPFADRLVLADDPREAMPGADLLDPGVLDGILARFATRYAVPEPRAVASLWAKWHFWSLLTPVVAASLLLDHGLPTGLDEVGIIQEPDGRTIGFRLRHGGQPIDPADPFERFGAVIDGHVAPLIRALVGRSGIAPRVLWSNVGNMLESLLRDIEAAGVPCSGHGDALLASRDWPGRPANPLFQPVRYVESGGQTRRRRRVCCLRYLIPELDLCSTCPLVKARPA